MKKSMRVMMRFKEGKANFKVIKSRQEVRRRERRGGRRRVSRILNEIKITADESIDIIRKARDSINKLAVENEITRLEIDSEKLRRSVSRGERVYRRS